MWVGMRDEAKLHLVNWKQVCRPLQTVRLGVRNLVQFNNALLEKWLWWHAMESEALWKMVVTCSLLIAKRI